MQEEAFNEAVAKIRTTMEVEDQRDKLLSIKAR